MGPWLLLLVLASGPDAATEPQAGVPPARARVESDRVVIEAVLEPAEAAVGDVLLLSVSVTAPAGSELGDVHAPGGLEPFALRDALQEPARETSDGGVSRRYHFELAHYQTGARAVPPLKLLVRTPGQEPYELEVPRTGVIIRSVLPEGEVELKDIRGPRALPSWPIRTWTLTVLLLLGALAVTGWLRSRWRRETLPAPPLPAHEEALRALERLASDPPAGPPKYYYARLTEILKHYLGRRYGFDAPGDTSSELMAALAEHPVPPETTRHMSQLLSESDLVKFAASLSGLEAQRTALARARAIVEMTKPEPRSAEVA